MTKSKLFSQLSFIPSPEFRIKVNDIIAENRKIPLQKAKYKKYLRPNEIALIKLAFGVES